MSLLPMFFRIVRSLIHTAYIYTTILILSIKLKTLLVWLNALISGSIGSNSKNIFVSRKAIGYISSRYNQKEPSSG